MRSKGGGLVASFAFAGALATLSACGGGAQCDAEGAQSALDSAAAGDVVELGACTIAGPLVVPPGVTLRGVTGTVVVAPEGSAGVVLRAGSPAATVEHLEVRAEGRIGVLVQPGAAATVADLTVNATRGVALAAADVADLTLTRISLVGPVTAENANDASWLRVVPTVPAAGTCPAGATCECMPGETGADGRVCDTAGQWATLTAAYGLYVEGTSQLVAGDVDVSGFASFGAVLRDTSGTWSGGSVRDTVGVGIRQISGNVMLSNVEVESTHQGVRGAPVYGVVATDSAVLTSTAMGLRDNDRYGVLVLGATATLEDLDASGNGDAAVWVGEGELSVTGASTMFADNAFAAIVAVDASELLVQGARVESTRESLRSLDFAGAIRVGDGAHLMGATGSAMFMDTAFSANERAGIVVELDAGMPAPTFMGVSVESSGAALGAIGGALDASGRLAPGPLGGWDAGIERLGSAAGNDAALTTALDAVGVGAAAPSDVPNPADRVGAIAPMF